MLNKILHYIHSITYKNEYIALDRIHEQLKREYNLQQALLNNLTFKLKGTGATIFDIKRDRFERTSYVCIVDKLDGENKGEMVIFIMSELIVPNHEPCKRDDMPHLIASFSSDEVEIQELHCEMLNGLYEKQGYGTMLIDTIKDIATKHNLTRIHGSLTERDAKTEEEKNNRNNFYKHRGFQLYFSDNECKEGTFELHLVR